MLRRRQKRALFIGLSLGGIALGVLVLVWSIARKEKTFPSLPIGAYVGQISGVEGSEGEFHTIYVERVSQANALLTVVLDEGWVPQVIPVARHYPDSGKGDQLTEDIPFNPITITRGERSYRLTGVHSFGEFTGDVMGDDGTRGVWSLWPVSSSHWKKSLDYAMAENVDLREWLSTKVSYLAVRKEAETRDTAIRERAEKLQRLSGFVEQTEVLQSKAGERKDALRGEVTRLEDEQRKRGKEVSTLVGELDLLGRITKRGKAVSLARKVARREHKWYLANWGVEEDTSELESYLQAAFHLDSAALEQQYAAAKEKRDLQQRVANEKRQIRELRQKLADRGGGEIAAPAVDMAHPERSRRTREKKERPQEGDKSWWDRLWD